MKQLLRPLFSGVSATVLAVPVFAGGFYVTLGNPDAHVRARQEGAVLTLKLAGCHEPEKAEISAVAIGNAGGQRQSIPLKLIRLPEPGSYALKQEWPRAGRYVLQFVAHDGGRVTSTLVLATPGGIDRHSAKMAMRLPAESDVAAFLTEGSQLKAAR